MKVLIVGYGSIGKQHTSAILHLGHSPIVVTKYPGSQKDVRYVTSIENSINANAAIICTPTYQHLHDFRKIINNTNIRKILIEKPITSNSVDAKKIKRLSHDKEIKVYVAFDMRFSPQLQYLRKNLQKIKKRIRLVKIYCGQYLPNWRPKTDYRKSYSSDRDRGGGVDLDLTHEIDYMLWLFGTPDKIDFIKTYKISTLEIKSPDYFKGIYNYTNFIVDVELDYFRKLDRQIIILGENEVLATLNFINETLIFDGKKINVNSKNNTLLLEDKEFLDRKKNKNLCSLDESLTVLEMINR